MTFPRRFCALLALAVFASCGGAVRPVANPGPERTVEAGETVTFDGSASTGSIESYRWDFGDGSEPKTGAVVEHVFSEEGDFSVSLTVRGPGGASTQAAIVHVGKSCLPTAVLDVLTASPEPGAPVLFSGGNSMPCAGRSITAYKWDFGDGTVNEGPALATTSHTFTAKGTYSIALEVTDERGAVGRATRTLNVGINAGKPQVQCSGPPQATVGIAAQFTASAQDPAGGTITSYEWTFSDDGSMASGSSASHLFPQTGTFTAQVIASTDDDRQSDPCTVTTQVVAPIDYSGTWLVNPQSGSLSGCTRFTLGFPATHLALTHSGTSMTAAPSGNNWPGTTLTGMEDAMSKGTYRVRGLLPEEDRTASGCGPVTPEHSVELTFTSATTVSGTWKVLYDFACIPTCSVSCNCVASGTFTGKKQ